ncbi:unnamed protein product [marine sediment metagenome]|uniref:Uncharacterized protein n=1 Tax=marine sediment metagenome TaxID=412755 RepID=X1CVC9_9ZZZZ
MFSSLALEQALANESPLLLFVSREEEDKFPLEGDKNFHYF